jgi:hypothetical protein
LSALRFSVLCLFFCLFSALWFITVHWISFSALRFSVLNVSLSRVVVPSRFFSAPCSSVFLVFISSFSFLRSTLNLLRFCPWQKGSTPARPYGVQMALLSLTKGVSASPALRGANGACLRTARSLRFITMWLDHCVSTPCGSNTVVPRRISFSARLFALLDHCVSSPCGSITAFQHHVTRSLRRFHVESPGSPPCSMAIFHHHVAQSLRFLAGFPRGLTFL